VFFKVNEKCMYNIYFEGHENKILHRKKVWRVPWHEDTIKKIRARITSRKCPQIVHLMFNGFF